MLNIVVLDGFAANPGDLSWQPLTEWGRLTVYDRTPASETVLRAREADVVLTNKVCLGSDELAQLPRLKYIGVLATGYNVVDVDAARQRGIVVTNVPAYSTDSVAQMVFAHLLALAQPVDYYAQAARQGAWSASPDFCYTDGPLMELAGKVMGIVGLGHIGRRVAAIASAFGMQVVAFTSKSVGELPLGVMKVSLEELLAKSDVVSLHCPLTPETRHLIDAGTLQLMKPSAILVNTGRGPLVDEEAVASALNDGRLSAYCADVLATEPPSADYPLLSCRKAHLTPHIAWATREARERLLLTAIANVRAFVQGHPQNVV